MHNERPDERRDTVFRQWRSNTHPGRVDAQRLRPALVDQRSARGITGIVLLSEMTGGATMATLKRHTFFLLLLSLVMLLLAAQKGGLRLRFDVPYDINMANTVNP